MYALKQGDKLQYTSGKTYEVIRVANHGILVKSGNERICLFQAKLKRELGKKVVEIIHI